MQVEGVPEPCGVRTEQLGSESPRLESQLSSLALGNRLDFSCLFPYVYYETVLMLPTS